MYIYVYVSTYHSMANKHHSHPRISRTSFTIPGLLCSHLQIKGSEPSRRKWAARLGAVDWFINGILTKSDDQTRHRWGLPEDGIHHLLRPKCGTEHFGTCSTVVWQRDTLSGIESKSLARNRGAHVSKHIYQLHLHLHLPFECQIISVYTNLSMNLYTHTISMEPALSLIHYLDRFRASSKPGSQQNREFDKTFTQRDIFGWRQPICSPVSGHVAPEAGSAAAWCRTPRPSCSGGEIKRLNRS